MQQIRMESRREHFHSAPICAIFKKKYTDKNDTLTLDREHSRDEENALAALDRPGDVVQEVIPPACS